MTGRLARCGSRAVRIAALLVATAALAARGEDPTFRLILSAERDYETALVRPAVTDAPEGSTISLIATDPLLGVSAESLPVATVAHQFENRSRAMPLLIDGYLVSDGGATTNAAVHDILTMGRVHNEDVETPENWNDHWLLENVETFTNETGKTWSGREYVSVSEGRLAIDTGVSSDASASVSCAIGKTPDPYRGYVIDTEAAFPHPYADLPDATGHRLGLTTGYTDDDQPDLVNFLYVTNGAWKVVPVEVCDPKVSTNWLIHISVDCRRQTATYCVRPTTNDAWTILGTAEGAGCVSVSEMIVKGVGSLGETEGHGFDAQLVKVDVTFGDGNLYPGCNFEETVVTGRIVSTTVHETSKTGGNFTVRLIDLYGNVVATEDYAFTAEGTMEFYVPATDLTPGMQYRAEIVFDDDVAETEASSEELVSESLMGRALTNECWGTSGIWIEENARTFDGDDPGTGIWTKGYKTFTYAWTENDWIRIQTNSDDYDYPSDAKVTFEATNTVSEAVTDYVTSFRVSFAEAAVDAEDADDAIFGFTVGATDDGLAYLCISNGVWEAVSRDVAVPTLDTEYTLTVYVEKELARQNYILTEPNGDQVLLMTVDLEADRCEDEYTHIDVFGVGKVTDLTGRLYSTDLVRIHVDFAEGTLDPGTNFTASAANGVLTFERLWETDHTNGNLVVVLRDKYGRIVGRRRITFNGLDDQKFTYYIEGMTPGENYTVEVQADVKGVDSEDSGYAEGFMARVLTNELWATEGWIREDGETFAGEKLGSGIWDIGDHYASMTNGLITVNTSGSDGENQRVLFTATNELPYHTGYEIRSALFFDAACSALPEHNGDFGITVLDIDPEGSEPVCRFAIIVNGEWVQVDPDLYTPKLETEYAVTIRVDYKRMTACYIVDADGDRRPTVLEEFSIADNLTVTPYLTAFYGTGRIRTHEGDGFDVRLFDISADLDEGLLTPGTNFTETVAAGTIRIRQLWMTDRTTGTYTIRLVDAYGRVVSTTTMTYQELIDQNFRVPVDGLVAGAAYDVEITVENNGEVVASDKGLIVEARPLDAWIYEDSETFLGNETGTGLWLQTNETAWVSETTSGRAIRFNAGSDERVLYSATNDSLLVRYSTIRELRFDLKFSEAGWYSYESAPSVPTNAIAGATLWTDSQDDEPAAEDCAIAVITTNRTWLVLEDTRSLVATTNRCTVKVRIDYANGYVRYMLVAAGATNVIHQYDFESFRSEKTGVAFDGSGYLWTMIGQAWDPNLIGGGTNEYADLNTAIRSTVGQDVTLFPLWWANQLVTVGEGTFRVDDPNNWLTVDFPRWYYVDITEEGTVRIYRFNQSNNWIDYADGSESNLVVNGSIYLVKSPEGLSWIAAQALTNWISGRIELATNINLTAHNWTPITGFTGTFDGKGRTITGLNNSYHNTDMPNGEYVCGPTNAWGRSAYGLFSTVTNATLRDVTFAGVSISNLADSVAALAGALAGNCAVSNVTVESGSILGRGETVAGVAGFADFADFLTFVCNTNRASVAAEAAETADYGVGLKAAGLLCVAGPTDPDAPLGTVVVTNNANFGIVSNTLYDVELYGGNVAQILAGTTLGAHFGEVHLTNNVAAGKVAADLVLSDANPILSTNFPAVNLASAYWGYDADNTFRRYLEANDCGTVPVDPVWHTARMLSDMFPNGTDNVGGRLNDKISASLPGATVTMTEGFDSWGPIVLDRNVTFDLGGKTIFTLYVDNTFTISEGVHATVRNGEIVVGLGEDDETMVEPFAGDTSNLTTNNLTVTKIDDTFYERTTIEFDGEPVSLLYLTSEDLNVPGTVVQIYEDSTVSIDTEAGTLCVNGVSRAKLSDTYAFAEVKDDDGNVIGYRVRLAATAANMPTMSVTMGADKVTVSVGNTRNGMTYTLQKKASLVEREWTSVGEGVPVTADNTPVQLETAVEGEQGYYRVLATETEGSGDDSGDEP